MCFSSALAQMVMICTNTKTVKIRVIHVILLNIYVMSSVKSRDFQTLTHAA